MTLFWFAFYGLIVTSLLGIIAYALHSKKERSGHHLERARCHKEIYILKEQLVEETRVELDANCSCDQRRALKVMLEDIDRR